MEILEKFLTINPYSRTGKKLNSISYILIHYVGNPGSSAIANRNYFESLKNKKIYASSQFIVGLQGEKIQCMPEDEVAYHAGNLTMNYNSIGIEVCHPDSSGKFNEVTIQSLGELVRYLVQKYNVSSNNIIRHYDVTGKQCPKYYVDNNRWQELKAKLLNNTSISIPEPEQKISSEVIYQNGSTIEPIYADSNLTNRIGTLSKYEQCTCIGKANNRYIVRYIVTGTSNYKVGFAKYSGKVKNISENIKIYSNGSTPENVYCDLNLTKKIGSLNRYEKCDCIGIFNGRYIVRYKVDGTNNYKVGFVKYSGGVR